MNFKSVEKLNAVRPGTMSLRVRPQAPYAAMVHEKPSLSCDMGDMTTRRKLCGGVCVQIPSVRV